MKRKLLYLIMFLWVIIGYGFTVDSTNNLQDSFPMVHYNLSGTQFYSTPPTFTSFFQQKNDTVLVSVNIKPNENMNMLINYMSQRDSVWANVINHWVSVNENQTNDTGQTYMGYLSHASEYSIGQINRFINQYDRATTTKHLFMDLGILIGVALAFLILVQKTDSNINPSPLFILLERLSVVALGAIGLYAFGDLISIFLISHDAFRFDYLINLLE